MEALGSLSAGQVGVRLPYGPTRGHGWDSTENSFPWELLGLGSKASLLRDQLLDTGAAARCVGTGAVLSVKQDPLGLEAQKASRRGQLLLRRNVPLLMGSLALEHFGL